MTSKMIERLNTPERRKAFVASQINIGIPFQIRALMKSRGATQSWLAEKTGMLQPRVSGLMRPGKTRPNIETLRRVAEAFDCGLMVKFVPFSELVSWSDGFDPESFAVPDFEADARSKASTEVSQTLPIISREASTYTMTEPVRILTTMDLPVWPGGRRGAYPTYSETLAGFTKSFVNTEYSFVSQVPMTAEAYLSLECAK